MEKTSLRWPTALRRRFLSGLYQRYRKRWPYTPYRATTQLGKQCYVQRLLASSDWLIAQQWLPSDRPMSPLILSGV